MKRFAAAVVCAGLLAAAPAQAQMAPPSTRIVLRGEVTAIGADTLSLTSRDGKALTIGLAKNWNVQVMKPISAAEIQTGSFIGATEMPQADGAGQALEVHVFPPGVKMGEGHYGWDLQQGSMMTNGTVGTVVAGARGRELDVNYSTGVRHIVVPPKTPIVRMTPGDRVLVKPGVKVFLVAVKTPSGGLVTNGVAVGEKGDAPPM
jgi:hypothetical protein